VAKRLDPRRPFVWLTDPFVWVMVHALGARSESCFRARKPTPLRLAHRQWLFILSPVRSLDIATAMLSHSRTAVRISPLTPFAAPVLCETRPAVVGGIVFVEVLCLCDPMSAGPLRGLPLLVLYACAVHGVVFRRAFQPAGGRAGSRFICHHESSWAMMRWRYHRE